MSENPNWLRSGIFGGVFASFGFLVPVAIVAPFFLTGVGVASMLDFTSIEGMGMHTEGFTEEQDELFFTLLMAIISIGQLAALRAFWKNNVSDCFDRP